MAQPRTPATDVATKPEVRETIGRRPSRSVKGREPRPDLASPRGPAEVPHDRPASHGLLVATADDPGFDELITAYQEVPDRYARAHRQFQEHRGSLQELYFAKRIHAGAGVLRPNSWFGRLVQRRSLCVRYDGTATACVQPEFETAIWRARRMERKSLLLLGGRSRRVLLEMIYSIIVYLLSVLDATEPTNGKALDDTARRERNERVASAIASARAELTRLDRFVDEAAKRASLRDYLLGIPIGMAACGLLIYYADGWTHPLAGRGVEDLADQARVCFACGAVGGVVSVMARITRRSTLNIDSAQGHGVTGLAGAIRPVIGAVFGLALFVFVAGGLVPIDVPTDQWRANLFFASLAFLAGFSERWAQDTIVHSAPSVTFLRNPVGSSPSSTSVAPNDTDAEGDLADVDVGSHSDASTEKDD
ncbi:MULTISPECIES: hypothetical protein [unclassified Nocardioides]|uniref:hypothetical protein n=1 Tax=unclassified Nocardioides TaxID=2615069 RepID=UPI000AF553DC|nr:MULTISPECIES: hypothetical protein [unclassified Nocardioides]